MDDSNNCLSAFHFKATYKCLKETNEKGKRGLFDLDNCNKRNTEQEWIKIDSKYDPENIQICRFHDHMTCLTATNKTEDGSRFSYVLLTEYKNVLQAIPAQLWKVEKDSGQILNYAESNLCLGHILPPLNQKPSSSFGLLVIAPCEDKITSITNKWSFNPVNNDESNSQKCVDIPLPRLHSPIESVDVTELNSLKRQSHFYFKKHSYTNFCLQLKYSGKEKIGFVWSVCDINQPEQRWLNVGSKNKSRSIQICQAHDGENKCLMDNSGTISLVDYRSTAENSPAQLWEMNRRGELVNVHSGLCLHEDKNKYVAKIFLSTTNCNDLAEGDETLWFFLPIFDTAGHRISTDVQIPDKKLIGNNQNSQSKFF